VLSELSYSLYSLGYISCNGCKTKAMNTCRYAFFRGSGNQPEWLVSLSPVVISESSKLKKIRYAIF